MKKVLFLLMVGAAAMMTSCGRSAKEQLRAENDSLLTVLSQRNAEIDEMMGTFNQISDGFQLINEAENRVNLETNKVGEGSVSTRQRITQDIEFIRTQMQANKEQIAKLQQQLKNSSTKSAELQKAVQSLTQQLQEKTEEIARLKEELRKKDIRIQELDAIVSGLNDLKNELIAENDAKALKVAVQDKALNTAWFVFGTKKELKEQNILKNGQVLQSADVNKDYFTECDIRTQQEIKLYSKSAKVLTNQPAGTYQLEEDTKGELTLKITDPEKFWAVSKYLVIQVK